MAKRVLHSGWDSFTLDPDTHESMDCRVCDTKMDVKRGIVGPRSWAGAMGGPKSKYDHFSCPHAGEDWHDQAYHLKVAAEKSPSQTLTRVFLDEAAEAIREKRPTKKLSGMHF